MVFTFFLFTIFTIINKSKSISISFPLSIYLSSILLFYILSIFFHLSIFYGLEHCLLLILLSSLPLGSFSLFLIFFFFLYLLLHPLFLFFLGFFFSFFFSLEFLSELILPLNLPTYIELPELILSNNLEFPHLFLVITQSLSNHH